MSLNRQAGLQQVAGQQAMDLTQSGQAALSSGVAGFDSGLGDGATGVGQMSGNDLSTGGNEIPGE